MRAKILRLDAAGQLSPREQQGATALSVLFDAASTAKSCGCDRWQFAVEVEHLVATGISATVLRELRQQGLVETAVETTPPNANKRRFRHLKSLSFPPRSCLVLTPAGEEIAAKTAASLPPSLTSSVSDSSADPPAEQPPIARPHWDPVSRTLRFNGRVVKQLRRPAICQVTILDAFEEEGWPDSIYDPLPPLDGVLPKQRLHNAINKLNSGLLVPHIRFFGNGDGLSVCWEWMGDDFESTDDHLRPTRKPHRPKRTSRRT